MHSGSGTAAREYVAGQSGPGSLIRELRTCTREYRNPVSQRTKVLTPMDRIPVMCGIRLSSCISSIDSKSFIQTVDALIRGETAPETPVRLVYGNCKNRESGKLKESLTGNMKAHQRLKPTACKQQSDLFESRIQLCLNEMQKLCIEHFNEETGNLTALPGVSQISAMITVAETGGDMSAFENSGKFTGWTGVRPGNEESAGKFKSIATAKGNKHLRAIIVQVARAASCTKGSFVPEISGEKIAEKSTGGHRKKNVSGNVACFERKNALQSLSCTYL